MSKPPERNRLATLPYRAMVEVSSLMKTQRGVWTRTARKLVGAFIVLALVDLNSSHVRDVVRGLVMSWQASQTEMKMGAIAAALDAEYASAAQYPPADQFHEFVRTWVSGQEGDPARDYWGSLITFVPEGVSYLLHSCGKDTVCGSEDDIRRRGGY